MKSDYSHDKVNVLVGQPEIVKNLEETMCPGDEIYPVCFTLADSELYERARGREDKQAEPRYVEMERRFAADREKYQEFSEKAPHLIGVYLPGDGSPWGNGLLLEEYITRKILTGLAKGTGNCIRGKS